MYWTAGNMMMMERLWLRMKADDDGGGDVGGDGSDGDGDVEKKKMTIQSIFHVQ